MMKLSEAIRLGTMTGPQAFGESFNGDATCALGAALRVVGGEGRSYGDITDFFPLAGAYVAEPVSGEHMLVLSAIRQLNDYHRWSRERIASWVDTIERAHEPREAMQALSLVGVGIE